MQTILARMLAGVGDHFATTAVRDGVEQLIDAVEPRVRLLPGSRRQLRRGVRTVLERVQGIAGLLPPPLDLSPAGYSSDRRVGLLFASPQSLCDSLRASPALAACLANPQAAANLQLMLVMQLNEETRLGSQLLPDGSVRAEVPQRVFSFERHRVIAASDQREPLLASAAAQAYALLCRSLASGVSEAESQRRLLEVERKALQLQLQHRTRVLNAEALNLHGNMSPEQMAQRLQQVEAALAASVLVSTLQGKLSLLRQVLEAPEQVLQARRQQVWLDRMGVVQAAGADALSLDYADIEMGYLQKRRRIVFAATLSRADWHAWQQRWPPAA